MLTGIFQSSNLELLGQTADFASRRHEVLAGNLANVHTPGYRARDLSVSDFQATLKKWLAAGRQPEVFSSGFPSSVSQAKSDMEAAKTSLLYHDDTNIDIERQVVEISKNQMIHNMALSIMHQQFQLLEAAVSERV